MVQDKAVVAVFIPSLAGGGAERVGLFLARALRVAGYDTDLVYARNRGPLAELAAVKELGVSLDAPNEMLCLPHLVRYLKRRKPDLVIALVHSAKIMAGLARYFVPQTRLAISVHNNLLAPGQYRFWLRRAFGFGIERHLYRHAVAAHSVSHELAEQTIRCFAIPRERSFMIYNPMEESCSSATVPGSHRSLFDRPVILAAGRLVPQKDHALLIRCFAAAGLAGTCRLLILGEGPLRPALERQVLQLNLQGDIALPGHVPDIRPYLANASAFALSSRFEGMPLALLEALQARLPIVSFACSCGPAELLAGGRFGWLVAPGDEVGFARALRDAIDGRSPKPSPEEIAAHLLQFSPEGIRLQYVSFVEHCLASSANR
jgi:glycosyltransferase involved in cell wall biosynthesis